MYNIIAIMGKAGSGKDTILKQVLAARPLDLNEIIQSTTRPKREGEAEGVNYYFLTEEQFACKVLNYEMLEASIHNWYYGTSYDALRSDVVNVGVFNPEALNYIYSTKGINLKVFYIDVDDKTRLLRQLNREENPNVDEIIRRYKTDKEDFYDLEFNYTEVENNDEEDLDLASHAIMVSLGLS